MSDFDTPSSYLADFTPIYTGFYGMKNHPSLPTSVDSTDKTFTHHKKQHHTLYPKVSIDKNQRLDRHRLEKKFYMQKQTEYNYYQLKSQIDYIQDVIKSYPYMASFYFSWLKKSKSILKKYSTSIESPDNVSFSSVFGYMQDEEIQQVYRNPDYEKELKEQLNVIETTSSSLSFERLQENYKPSTAYFQCPVSPVIYSTHQIYWHY